MVGPTKFPLSYPGTDTPRPSSKHSAPLSMPAWMSDSTRCLASGEMTGPTSVPSFSPAPHLSFFALSTSSGSQFTVSPTQRTVERAMQRCPAAPKAAPTSAFRVASLSQSGMIVAWFLAPRLACTRLPFLVPRSKMYSPAALPPTKEMALIFGASQMKLTVSCAPWTTCSTPSGRPDSCKSLASIMVAPGSRSDGLMIIEFPHTVAKENIHIGIMAGKLKGHIPAVTPRG
mmetsp:Transcript_108656/g.233957  ORF Transcript_108656/g.233957 Transcript_108656/m.233957 type:complete len:230 (+) Transcript_108656:565-1254(+)